MSIQERLSTDGSNDTLIDRYRQVREQSLNLCAPLQIEDYQIQPMDDASPPKWHLAHTTWFFETFILKENARGYQPFHEAYEVLFNSYYNGVGEQYPRSNRGFLSRPTLSDVFAYREFVDTEMALLLSNEITSELFAAIELGLNHEQQHQELILTDLKYNLGNNPLRPSYIESDGEGSKSENSNAENIEKSRVASHPVPVSFIEFEAGRFSIGANGDQGFVFDNESPRHEVLLNSYSLANRLVTNQEFLEFIEDGGYERPELWLSDGWSRQRTENRWQSPLYWRRDGGVYHEYSLRGEAPVDGALPVCHVSAYEADAYARWRGCRLPTEAEWEVAAAGLMPSGNFVQSGNFHPQAVADGEGLRQMFGDVWEWTASSYGPYPGFNAFAGQLGEYNGKFMANQLVLRGGSCITSRGHIRSSYRNFFYPADRWQFSGIRLAEDLN